MDNTPDTQPYEPALQARSMPIHKNGPCRNRLIDCMGSFKKLQKRLSGASRGIPCSLLPLLSLAIHNYQLCISAPLPTDNLALALCLSPCCNCAETNGWAGEKNHAHFQRSEENYAALLPKPGENQQPSAEKREWDFKGRERKILRNASLSLSPFNRVKGLVPCLSEARTPHAASCTQAARGIGRGTVLVTRTALSALGLLSGVACSPWSLFQSAPLNESEVL